MKNEGNKHKDIAFWIVLVLAAVLYLAFLELNKNMLFGWVMTALLITGFVMQRRKTRYRGIPLRLGTWAGFFLLLWVIGMISWPPVRTVPATDHISGCTEPVQTQYGPVSGVISEEKGIEVYAGIPYAEPPVGELRWKKPRDPEPWTDVLVCDQFAAMSMQSVNIPLMDSLAQIIGYHDYQFSMDDHYRPPVSEDSLYLNIWKPAGKQEKLPVAVYIHGGSLQTGQPWYADYSGEGYAKSGVICVNMGYRLGVFGFLADEEMLAEEGTAGNFGLLDQIKALQWVQDNIEAFGGDPNNVTLIGESAGAVCVDALCVSPLAEGLFQRAILESSTLSSPQPPHSYRSFADALASGKALKEKYGCETLAELRDLPASKITGEMETQHHVTADGYVLADDPYELRKQGIHNEQAILHGFNDQESGPFIIFSRANKKNYEEKVRRYFGEYTDDVLALYPASTDAEADRNWAEIYGALFFNYSHYCLNRLAAQENIPVYEYLFTRQNGRLSSWHSGEMVYTFGVIPEESDLYDYEDRRLSEIMHTFWVNFITTGNPNGEELPDFEENTTSEKIMVFGETEEMRSEPYLKLYEILDRMTGFKN